MLPKKSFTLIAVFLFSQVWSANITVNVQQGQHPINPHLYGRNDAVGLTAWFAPTDSQLTFLREVGLRFSRESGGNNSSKFNWRKKLSSHPDWYNNVYVHDWDSIASIIQSKLPEIDAMFAIPTTGWAAASDSCNYNESLYDPSHSRAAENLACGGNYLKYLEPWPGDSAAGILDHWFGAGGLGLDSNRFRIWNLDNESEVWGSTHDDIFSIAPTAEEVVQKYLEAARAAKRLRPGIKLAGPVFTNEWQWWNGPSGYTNGLSWMEYFIKRFAEESQKDGVQLIDDFDFHFYPTYDGTATGPQGDEALLQWHRIWFDRSYDFPQANGSKTYPGGVWDESQTKEYIFGRVREWVTQYFGANANIGVGISEAGFNGSAGNPPASVAAVWYASQLGTFADSSVSFFMPWWWYPGMWEVMHLFSRYGGDLAVQSTSDLDSLVSAYTSLRPGRDTLVTILVNRSQNSSQIAQVQMSGFEASVDIAQTLQLSNLSGETYVSHAQNALQTGSLSLTRNAAQTTYSINLPALSVTAVVISSVSESPLRTAFLREKKLPRFGLDHGVLQVPETVFRTGERIHIFDLQGRQVWSGVASSSRINLPKDIYGQIFITTESVSQELFVSPM